MFQSANRGLPTLSPKLSRRDPLRSKHVFQSLPAVELLSVCIYREVGLRSTFTAMALTLTGICKRGIDRDRSWCSIMAKGSWINSVRVSQNSTYGTGSGSIYISVDYPSALGVSFRQILEECQWSYELVGHWSHQNNVVRLLNVSTASQDGLQMRLTNIASGTILAIIIAAVAAQNAEPAYGLIVLVPLVMTDPDLADNSWDENESTVKLTSDRLLSDLRTTFEGKHSDRRDHWHNNSFKMLNEIVKMLSSSIMMFATLDILYKS